MQLMEVVDVRRMHDGGMETSPFRANGCLNPNVHCGHPHKTQYGEKHFQSNKGVVLAHFTEGNRCFFGNANADFFQNHICI